MIKGMKTANGEVRVPILILSTNKDAGFAEYLQTRAANDAMHAFCSGIDYGTLYLIYRKWTSREEYYEGVKDAVFRETIAYKEVVTCKDCRYAVNEPDRDGSDVWICNYNLWRWAEGIRCPDGFCSEGDRKEKENV